MKANELRIGNYVLDNLGGLLKIKGVSEQSDLSHIIGIPITEEWLMKFGFEKEIYSSPYSYKVYYKIPSVISLELFPQCNNNIYFEYEWGDVWIKSVHQLQNLYFALTGDELEIEEKFGSPK